MMEFTKEMIGRVAKGTIRPENGRIEGVGKTGRFEGEIRWIADEGEIAEVVDDGVSFFIYADEIEELG